MAKATAKASDPQSEREWHMECLLSGQAVNVMNYRLASEHLTSNWGRVYYRRG